MKLRLEQYSEAAAGAVDIREFARFFITGVVATIGNVSVEWIARHFMSFEWALVAGIATGCTISFLMSKIFAFRSRTWESAPGEVARFAIVYGCGVLLFWLISVNVRPLLTAAHWERQVAEMAAVLIGAGVMTFTSYFGHRFFTYRQTTRARVV
jgi:putative flippase GtrA